MKYLKIMIGIVAAAFAASQAFLVAVNFGQLRDARPAGVKEVMTGPFGLQGVPLLAYNGAFAAAGVAASFVLFRSAYPRQKPEEPAAKPEPVSGVDEPPPDGKRVEP